MPGHLSVDCRRPLGKIAGNDLRRGHRTFSDARPVGSPRFDGKEHLAVEPEERGETALSQSVSHRYRAADLLRFFRRRDMSIRIAGLSRHVRLFIISCLMVGLCLASLQTSVQAKHNRFYWDGTTLICRVYGIPDFDQHRSSLPNNGDSYCVPTSAVD